MSFKAFATLQMDPPSSQSEVRAIAGYGVFDGTAAVDLGGAYSAYTYVTLASTDTFSTTRSKAQASVVADFNQRTGRTDGSTMTFVWLDDKGLI